ncbi:MAG: hypothetical protein AAF378_18930 [Cyanobacteria bacterium P01_A01_bin.84]
MGKTSAKLPDITFKVCDRFLQNLKSRNSQVPNSTVFLDKVDKLIVRLYSQSKSEDLRSRCLDLIDDMAEMGIYELNKALQDFER